MNKYILNSPIHFLFAVLLLLSSVMANHVWNGNNSAYNFPMPLYGVAWTITAGNISLQPIGMANGGFRGSFVESLDATTGGSIPLLNTHSRPMPTPDPTLLMMPPGLSPTTLLDSSTASIPLLNTTHSPPMPTPESTWLMIPPGFSTTTLLDSPDIRNVQIDSPTASNVQVDFPSLSNVQIESPAVFNGQGESSTSDTVSVTQYLFDQASTLKNDTLPATPCLIDQRSNLKNDSGHEVCEDMPFLLTEKFYEDGYYWRKYGRRGLARGEYICHYYRCAKASCKMRRKIVCFPNGQITKIEYDGDIHNHPKPQDVPTTFGVHGFPEGLHNGEVREGFQIRGTSSSMQRVISTSDQLVSAGYPEPLSTSLGTDATEVCYSMPRIIHKIPEIHVIKTVCESDLLDDGYGWIKYGQKNIKSNLNSRSYYKCKAEGCSVKKYIEKCLNDPTSIITRYKGKHNHELPNP